MLKFKVPEVDAKYSTIRTTDPRIHLPGKNATGWGGKLSDITLAAADKLFQDPKQNLLQLKSVEKIQPTRNVNKPAPADTKEEEKS